MKKSLLAAVGLSLVIATPAYANEGRAEVRGGVLWGFGDSEGVAGIALGYDWDLGDSAFGGVEVSGDKILEDGSKIAFGATGRLGIKAGESTKVYADGGYTSKPCTGCDDSLHVGAGLEQKLGTSVYIKVAYRHFFSGAGDFDAVVGGLGLNF
jgi:opacity protein-like surface antigen